MIKTIREKLYANEMYYDAYQNGSGEIEIYVDWGDWKHDHFALDWFMIEKFNLACIRNETTEEDGSDCYSSIHFYKVEA
jgi:hypothetical protein